MLLLAVGAAEIHEHHKWTIGESEDPPENSAHCPSLSKDLLAAHAVNNIILLAVSDKLSMQKFGKSWIKNVEAANIT